MNQIIQLFETTFTDPDMMKWAIYLVAGVAGITLAIALSSLISGLYSPVKKQLSKLSKESTAHDDLAKEYESSLEHTIDKLKHIPFINKNYQGDSSTKKLLIHAGFHSQDALKIFNSIKLLLLLISGGIVVALINNISTYSTTTVVYIIAFVLGTAYLLPGIILKKIAERRMTDLKRFFPDALDLLIVCCESGLGLLESFQRVAKELQLAHPTLSFELNLVCSKVRYGLTLQQALKEFSDRTGLEDIRGLNSVIVQSLRLGTGVAATIRIYSDEYREKRLQAAEENAAKLGVKMIFPMMCCIWPSFFIVAIGPAVLKVMAVWGEAF
ncbi:type II secretion system F family protein [Moritella sp. Urea-trap-13]|uniref:type II secretion system F family protein n=1 Tax=Moritella sp. Urea-trap-13 TaxID=2058327 RepID=UPI000C3349A8|nr:type II secretion system F family protein [Moritella sp. Urea-trap-13]PKH06278.1 TadC [Moritella sp. Urea-trap-13]